ncbi:MAG: Maf family protein [Bdellovibrionales bacterium]
MNKKTYQLILASNSPRRRELLQNAGYLFSFDSVNISETLEENVNLTDAIQRLARQKGEAYVISRNLLKPKDILVLSADTMVVVDESALGKPKNTTEAESFLMRLSGRWHRVITAIHIINLYQNETVTKFASTEVQFRNLSKNEIAQYISSGEPMDKAGAYAIQGLGGKFVIKINGSLSNVIGLPMELLESVLEDKGWAVEKIK